MVPWVLGWVPRQRRRAPVFVFVLVVGGLIACGPPSETPAADPSATEPTTPIAPDAPAGDLDPDALAGFRCSPVEDEGWTATGTLTNSGTERAKYVVTVLVAGPSSTAVQAKRQVVDLDSGASEQVELTSLPVPIEGELSCQAQVVRRP